jgi:hypothetical protein
MVLGFVLAMFLIIGCSAAELNQSLSDVTGQNIRVIRSYPINKFTAFSGNTVYTYSQNSKGGSSCEIFFEVNKQNTIILTSYRGEACNSFYDSTLKPGQTH